MGEIVKGLEAWNIICDKIFKYHDKQLAELDILQQQEYFKGLSELELKIWSIKKIGSVVKTRSSVVNPNLVMHKDFEKVWELFKKLD